MFTDKKAQNQAFVSRNFLITVRISGIEPMFNQRQINENQIFFSTALSYFEVEHINTNQSNIFENM